MGLKVRKVITILEECCLWYILKDFLIGLRGGFEKHCTRASLHSDTVEDLIRISVEGQVWKMLMLERVWPVGLAKAKDQEGQTTGIGHLRGM